MYKGVVQSAFLATLEPCCFLLTNTRSKLLPATVLNCTWLLAGTTPSLNSAVLGSLSSSVSLSLSVSLLSFSSRSVLMALQWNETLVSLGLLIFQRPLQVLVNCSFLGFERVEDFRHKRP